MEATKEIINEFRSTLIKAIKTSIKKYAVSDCQFGLHILPFGCKPVVCDDNEQYQLDCFFFSDDEDVQMRLITMNNEEDADAMLEDLATNSLIDIALGLTDENLRNIYKNELNKNFDKGYSYDDIKNTFVQVDECKFQLKGIFRIDEGEIWFRFECPLVGINSIEIEDIPLNVLTQILAR